MKAAVIALAFLLGTTTDIEAVRIPIAEHHAVEDMRKVWDIENGCLADGATLELLEAAEEKAEALPEDSEHKENLAAIAEAARAELTKPKLRYYGNCRITGYCNCAACCGVWAGGGTASGTVPTAGRTVANGDLPFGTRVLIDGHEYIVEDRGVPGGCFDIYFDQHAQASACGLRYTDIYIVEG